MIELDCTYEESKKILELGFDFTSICGNFELHEEGKITKFVLVERHDDGLVSLWDCSEHEANIYSTKSWWIIPIIPKAALEACLPREIEIDDLDLLKYVMDSYESLSYSRILPSISGECLKYEVPKKGMFFNSAFEAFLWLHEYYPEELKKKFDEVMG